jgi:hypothetical protein
MHERGRQRGERFEDERALGQTRVRHDQSGLVHDAIAVEQQIEVERARGVAFAAFAPGRALEREQRVEKRARRERRLDANDGVQIRACAATDGSVSKTGESAATRVSGNAASERSAESSCAARSPRLVPIETYASFTRRP